MTGNHFFDDLEEVRSGIIDADVVSLFFPYFGKTVLIDTRSNGADGPAIILTDMVRNPQERVKSMEKLRPGFPDVHKMILIPWVRYIYTLRESGIWTTIVERLEECSYLDAEQAADAIFHELKLLERRELITVVKGSTYETIWSRDMSN